MTLNSKKCIFGVQGGKFLGFILTHKGIEANSEKCVTIIEIRIPNTLKEVQRLIGRLVALSKFLLNTTKPIFKLLKKQEGTQWNEECEANFLKLKEFLASPLILTRPLPGMNLILYLVVSEHAISSIIVVQEEKKIKIQVTMSVESSKMQRLDIR